MTSLHAIDLNRPPPYVYQATRLTKAVVDLGLDRRVKEHGRSLTTSCRLAFWLAKQQEGWAPAMLLQSRIQLRRADSRRHPALFDADGPTAKEWQPTSFGRGKEGSGKSQNYGLNECLDWMKRDFSDESRRNAFSLKSH